MKISKNLMLLALVFVFGTAFYACKEESTAPENTDLVPPPVNLQATSVNDSAFFVKFDAPEDLNKTLFSHYTLRYFVDNNEYVKTVDSSIGGVAFINRLFRNRTYTVEIRTHYIDKRKSASSEIEWAPAKRFITLNSGPIRLFTSDAPDSLLARGIDLDENKTENEGEDNERITWIVDTLTTDNIARWHVGLESSSGSDVKIGSAALLNFPNSGSSESAELGPIVAANNLNDVFDSEGLDAKSYEEKVYDLNSDVTLDDKKGAVIYLRMPASAGANEYKYAKIFVKYIDGNWLQKLEMVINGETVELSYIEIEASVQTNAGMPYAKR